MNNPRQLAFQALQNVYQRHAYTDIALDRVFTSTSISSFDRHLVSELVYGIVRRKRTLDSLINQLATKKATQQPLNLRIILQLGLYQLRYLDKIPESAAVNSSVDLAKKNGLSKLSGVVNGILRSYLRLSAEEDSLILPSDFIPRLGVKYSFPDWLVSHFINEFNVKQTKKLLDWYNQSPFIDLRVNSLKITKENLQEILLNNGIETTFLPNIPQGLRLTNSAGNITRLDCFKEGLFTIQDASAQLVTNFLNPQPHDTIIDACAAPGGKTTHMAELMQDTGTIIGCDRQLSRLKKVTENAERLQLKSIQVVEGDSSQLREWENKADKVLVDVPCSGLGTLHKNPDIRWHKKPEDIKALTELQLKILENSAKWVKNNGVLVYSTCTLNKEENENIITKFLVNNSQWQLDTKNNNPNFDFSITSKGIVKIFPPVDNMDGFFMAKLIKGE
ncbi:ribosomal RNA small subunit methyltransferase B [Geminocystis sp. NIES-3708]|uniref:16S rRNA (cytosine(967)-C(5))-methyltransferase n=1 Tax=Geminocystis sp. NIES-3708 TaxID=1615909 RepID=UPI0005FCC3EB|nr:16S rRNA (cytosine(967)-C(5))-methyltransferase [Geminocystis sp. NIES-3708]BAQ62008.1 ribosomal RNA small subunit methyltransferase B [Geminocystis sp. NIES-3708]